MLAFVASLVDVVGIPMKRSGARAVQSGIWNQLSL
jgi:hypothetical protein